MGVLVLARCANYLGWSVFAQDMLAKTSGITTQRLQPEACQSFAVRMSMDLRIFELHFYITASTFIARVNA